MVGRSRTVSVGEKPLGWARCRSASSHAPTPLCGQAPALGVGEPETARTELLLSADAMLFLERVNDVTLLLVDPARDGHDEELQHVGNRRHPGRAEQRALGGHERRDPASVQRRISPSDGVDRVLGQYDLGGLTAYQRLMLWGFRGDLRHDEGDTRWVNYNTSPFSSRSTAS